MCTEFHRCTQPGHLLHCMFTEFHRCFFALFVQGAPHPPQLLMGDTWSKPYSREYAAFPAAWLRGAKFWPTTGTNSSTVFSRAFPSLNTSSEANILCFPCCAPARSCGQRLRRPQPRLHAPAGVPGDRGSRSCNCVISS